MDFGGSFPFVVQESIQAFYFNNKQATVAPFVLHYRASDNSKIEIQSFCVISEHLQHNTYVVNIFQEKVLNSIKEMFPWITKVIYFSDRAPTQYKNK